MSDLFRHYDQIANAEDLAMGESLAGGFAPIAGSSFNCMRRFLADVDPASEVHVAIDLVPEPLRERALSQVKRGEHLCESPIERKLFPWLVCQAYSCFRQLPTVLLPGKSEQLESHTVAVVPQLKIGTRRADFALASRRGGPIRFVIVECDGAAFHANVHKDVARDADLMRYRNVLDVHPIAGKEIYKDVRKAALGAARALTTAWSRTNRATDAKFA